YANEVILPFRTDSKFPDIDADCTSGPTVNLKRSFPPGSEWLYAKIYCGAHDADRVLANQVTRMVGEFNDRHVLNNWFFIRYHDPEPHIRLRFQTNGESHVRIDAELMDAVCKHISPLIPLGIVHRIAYDTYEREMER